MPRLSTDVGKVLQRQRKKIAKQIAALGEDLQRTEQMIAVHDSKYAARVARKPGRATAASRRGRVTK